MAEASFRLRYDGGHAADHRIDMRNLGKSLIGVEKIVSDSLVVAFQGRLPKPREHRDIELLVEAPRAHCLDISVLLVMAPGLLPFVQEILKDYTKEYVSALLGHVLSFFGGRQKEADAHMEKLLELTREMHAEHLIDRSEDRAYALATQENMLRLVDKLHPAARQVVAPVGRSCNELILPAPVAGHTAVIDVAMADAIRAKEPVEVGDMTRMIVHVDTVSISRRTMRVMLPDDQEARLVDAAIRDPAFDEDPNHNVYTAALGGLLAVDVKPTYRKETGELIKLHVMNAEAA